MSNLLIIGKISVHNLCTLSKKMQICLLFLFEEDFFNGNF
jgi:hypothetical protein